MVYNILYDVLCIFRPVDGWSHSTEGWTHRVNDSPAPRTPRGGRQKIRRNIYEAQQQKRWVPTYHKPRFTELIPRARLHLASELMLRQLWDDAGDTAVNENNGVIQKWVVIPFWSDSIVFNDSNITSVITELSQC